MSGQPTDEGPSFFVQSLPGSFSELGALGRELRLDPGAELWKEGDPGDHVVLLVEGRLEVVHQTPDGEEITIRHLYPGAVAGEMAALDGQTRSATVRAHGAARVLMIPAGRFREFLRSRPDLLEQLFWLQVERVRSLTWRVSRTHHKAITDPLTGLYNYGFFRERLALELERAQMTRRPARARDVRHRPLQALQRHARPPGRQPRAAEGGELLREAGRRGDVVARYGGEEFVALLYGATTADAWRLAENFRGAVSGQGFAGEASQPLGRMTVSGGVAAFPLDAQDDIGLVKAADARLYQAKERGRDRTVGPEGEPR